MTVICGASWPGSFFLGSSCVRLGFVSLVLRIFVLAPIAEIIFFSSPQVRCPFALEWSLALSLVLPANVVFPGPAGATGVPPLCFTNRSSLIPAQYYSYLIRLIALAFPAQTINAFMTFCLSAQRCCPIPGKPAIRVRLPASSTLRVA